MKLTLKVKTRAKQTRIECVSENSYKVWVKEAPENGRANEAVIEALSGYLKISKSRISILLGHTSTKKVLNVAQLV